MSDSTFKITFVGAGRMASAMIKSLLGSRIYAPSDIACCSAKDGTAEKLAAETAIHIIDIDSCTPFVTDCLMLACKPQQLETISPTIISCSQKSLLISILAGTRTSTLQNKFKNVRNIVRVMPNTPGSVGEGVSAFASSGSLSQEDRESVTSILQSMGEVLEVKEKELDSITAISGSGPAYLFLFVEGLYHAALKQGFDEATAMMLAKQTVIGSAKLLEQSGETPEALRIQVTSPGGTTQAAIESFQSNNFFQIIEEATVACRKRSIELSQL